MKTAQQIVETALRLLSYVAGRIDTIDDTDKQNEKILIYLQGQADGLQNLLNEIK